MYVCATVHEKDQYLDKYNVVLVRIIESRSLMFILIAIATMRQFCCCWFFFFFLKTLLISDAFALFFLLDFEYTNWECKEKSHICTSGTSLCGKHQLILIFTWSIMLYIMFWTCADSFEQSLGIYLSNCVVCMLHILEDINLGVEGEVLGSKSTGSVTEKHRNNMTQDTTIYIYYCLFRF